MVEALGFRSLGGLGFRSCLGFGSCVCFRGGPRYRNAATGAEPPRAQSFRRFAQVLMHNIHEDGVQSNLFVITCEDEETLNPKP